MGSLCVLVLDAGEHCAWEHFRHFNMVGCPRQKLDVDPKGLMG